MKRILKTAIALLLCFACCLPMLVACNKDTNENQANSTTDGESTNEIQNIPSDAIPLSALANYKLVYADGNCPMSAYKKILKLQEAIKNSYGCELTVKDDYYRGSSIFVIEEYEILIGQTNRPETAEILKDMKVNDFSVQVSNKKLVVAAYEEEQLVEALDRLINVISSAPEGYFFSPEMAFSHTGTYQVDEFVLDGHSISEYTLVYAQNCKYGKTICEDIAEMVELKSGYRLNIISDNKESTGREILIGKTNRNLPDGVTAPSQEGGCFVGFGGTSLYCYAESDYSALAAARRLLNEITAGSSKVNVIDLASGSFVAENTSIVSMSFNVLVSSKDDERTQSVIDMIKKHDPDTLGVQEASVAWMNSLKAALGDEYNYVGIGRDKNGSGEHSAIFYKKDKFTLIESGTKWLSDTPDKVSKYSGSKCNRIFTYALLERNSDHKQFMHINTHTDHTSEDLTVRPKQVKVITEFMKKYPDVPMIISGDFNDTPEKESIRHMLSSGLDNSSEVAFSSVTTGTFKTSVIDYFFVTKDDFIVYDYNVDPSQMNGVKPSDHNPVIIRYDLR